MNANTENLRKAYAIAITAAESPNTSERERPVFRMIAEEIWKAASTPADQLALREAAAASEKGSLQARGGSK